jgi:hypothetical protein
MVVILGCMIAGFTFVLDVGVAFEKISWARGNVGEWFVYPRTVCKASFSSGFFGCYAAYVSHANVADTHTSWSLLSFLILVKLIGCLLLDFLSSLF